MSAQAIHKIAIHGVPRSGTSWIGEILNSSPNTIYKFQPLFSYAFKDFLSPTSSASRIEEFFARLARAQDDFLDQTNKREEGILPAFGKKEATHVCYKEVRYHHILENLLLQCEDVRLIAVIRNPLFVLSSWKSSPREFRVDQEWKFEEEWRFAQKKNCGRSEEFFGFEKWKEVALIFHKLRESYPDRVRILRYEQLVSDPKGQTSEIFDFCGLPVELQTMKFIAQSTQSFRNDDPYSVFKADKFTSVQSHCLSDQIVREIRHSMCDSELFHYLEPIG